MHARQQIREAIGTLLAGLTTTGSNVFQSRLYPLEADTLPALLISSEQEDLESINTIGRPRQMERNLTLNVTAVQSATADLDDVLDTICAEVETVIGADPSLGSLVSDCVLASVAYEYEAGGNKPHGRAIMLWAVTYRIHENAPEVIV